MMRVEPELSKREADALDRARAKADLVHWLRREAASRDGEMAWYVARTWWRADSVSNDLRASGIESVCPLWRHWKRRPRSNTRYPVEIPMFGNHLFVRLLKAESAWVGVMSFSGIDCLLGAGETPVPLRDDEMTKVLELLEMPSNHACTKSVGLEVGDIVAHPLGMFAELRAIVRELDVRKREALISTVLFGREMSTRCGIDELERLA